MSVTPGAIVELHAAAARNGVAAGSNVPLTNVWANTGSLGRGFDGQVLGIAGTASSGWAGSGTPADPHRLVQSAAGGDYVRIPKLAVTGSKVFTLESWFYSPPVPPSPEPPAYAYYFILTEWGPMVVTYPEVGLCIYAPNGPTAPGYARFFYRDQDGGNASIFGPGGTVTDICDGQLHHMIGASDGAHAVLVVDGVSGIPAAVPAGTIGITDTLFGAQVAGSHCMKGGALVAGRVYDFYLDEDQRLANYEAGPLAVAGAVQPRPRHVAPTGGPAEEVVSVLVGTGAAQVDLVAEGLVDPESVTDSDCEHGFESAEFEVDGQPHIRAHNALVDEAPVRVVRDGKTTFEGSVAVISDAVSPHVVECAGLYDKLSRDESYAAACVETRYDLFFDAPKALCEYLVGQRSVNIDANLDGQFQFIIPKGSRTKANQCRFYCLVPLSGLGPYTKISRITGTWTCGGTGAVVAVIGAVTDTPFTAAPSDYVFVSSVWSEAASNGAFDSDDIPAGTGLDFADYKFVVAGGWAFADDAETAAEEFCQLRDLTIYVDRLTAPRPDQIIAEIACPADGSICLGAATEALGGPVTQFMVDPFTTRAEAIESARALASGIMDVGVWDDATVHVRARPTSPPERTHWLALSLADLADPTRDWGIVRDTEAGIDAICCSYNVLSHATKPNGTACSVYYPARPARAAARVAMLELGDATDAEAAAAAQQVYTYQSQLASGSVPLDPDHLTARYGAAVVPTVDGALLPIDHIRSWDWVMCVNAADPDARGPFMLSRVERNADGVNIEVGGDYWEHPGYAHSERKGRYVRAHWQQTKRKEWSKTKPKGKGWHRQGKRWWRYRKVWVEGRYR